MIGVDTNVLVRYIVHDDEDQFERARALLENECSESHPAFVNIVVLCELVWVLTASYQVDKEGIVQVLEQLLMTRQVVIQHREIVAAAVNAFRSSRAGFADCVIAQINRSAGCAKTATFDRRSRDLATTLLLASKQP